MEWSKSKINLVLDLYLIRNEAKKNYYGFVRDIKPINNFQSFTINLVSIKRHINYRIKNTRLLYNCSFYITYSKLFITCFKIKPPN